MSQGRSDSNSRKSSFKFSSYIYIMTRRLHNNALILLLKPCDSILFADLVFNSNSSWSDLASGDSVSRSDQDNVKVHAENACRRVVLKAKIDVLSNSKSETTGVGEVYFLQFVFFDLEASVEDFVGLEATYLFITFSDNCSVMLINVSSNYHVRK